MADRLQHKVSALRALARALSVDVSQWDSAVMVLRKICAAKGVAFGHTFREIDLLQALARAFGVEVSMFDRDYTVIWRALLDHFGSSWTRHEYEVTLIRRAAETAGFLGGGVPAPEPEPEPEPEPDVTGDLSVALSGASLGASGSVAVTGDLSVALGDVSLEASGSVLGAGVVLETASFNGSNNYMRTIGTSETILESKQFTFSCWLKRDVDDTTLYIWSLGPTNSSVRFAVILSTVDNTILLVGRNASDVQILNVRSTVNAVTVADGWVHVFTTGDMADQGTLQMRVNGVDVIGTVTTFTDDEIDFQFINNQRYTVGGNTQGPAPTSLFDGCMAQLWFDNVNVADHTKFYDNGPVDLGADGTGTGLAQPDFYFHQAGADFGLNGGTDFDLTVNGTLVECGDEP